eukprot:421556-Rhodomonas_salina.1
MAIRREEFVGSEPAGVTTSRTVGRGSFGVQELCAHNTTGYVSRVERRQGRGSLELSRLAVSDDSHHDLPGESEAQRITSE